MCVCRVFCEAFGLMTASCMFLATILMSLYQECQGHGVLPVLRDLYRAVKDYRAQGEERGYRTRIVSKLNALLLLYGRQLAFQEGFTPAMFIRENRSVVWERPHQDPARTFFILLDLEYCFAFVRYNPLPSEYYIVHVLDEGGFLFARKDLDTGEDLGSRLVRQSRYFHMSYLVCEQDPVRLTSTSLCSNLGVQLSFRNQSTNVPFLGRAMNLTAGERDELIELATGQGILRVSGSRLGRPVHVDVDEYPLQPVSQQELAELSRKTVEPYLRQTVPAQADAVTQRGHHIGTEPHRKAAPRRPHPAHHQGPAPREPRTGTLQRQIKRPPPSARPAQRDPGRLPADPERLLHAYEATPVVLSIIAKTLGWIPSKISRCIQRIISAGIWDRGPTFGHNLKTYVLTDCGAQYCQVYGISSQRDKSGNDRVHQVIANSSVAKIEEWLRNHFPDANIEARINGASYVVGVDRSIQPDRLIITPGLRLAVQAAYKHGAREEAANAYLLAAIPELGPQYVICVAHSVGHMQAITRHRDERLKQLDEQEHRERVRSKIRVTNIGDVLSGNFDTSFLRKPCS